VEPTITDVGGSRQRERGRDCEIVVTLEERLGSEDHVWFKDQWMVAPLCDD
jgi:hypothetical protein